MIRCFLPVPSRPTNAPRSLFPRPVHRSEGVSRRKFFATLGAAGIASLLRGAGRSEIRPNEVGITTASFQPQFRAAGAPERMVLQDLPRIAAEELGLRIIDMNTTILGSHEASHVERFRGLVDAAGCFVTNLKVNANLPLESEDRTERDRALAQYREWIRAAAALGARWLRPIPSQKRPRLDTLIDSYRRLSDLAEPQGIRIIVENYRWIESEPAVVPELIRRLDGRIAASPDLANWVDHRTRLAGLAAMFPLAVTCDFKVRELTPAGEHPEFNLKECFEVAMRAGFRGPWCLEHINPKRTELMRELKLLTSMIRGWSGQ